MGHERRSQFGFGGICILSQANKTLVLLVWDVDLGSGLVTDLLHASSNEFAIACE